MKKILVIFSLAVLLIGVVSADIAYVYKNEKSLNEEAINLIESKNIELDLISEKNLKNVNLQNYDAVLISEKIQTKYISAHTNVILLEPKLAEYFSFLSKGRTSKVSSNMPLQVSNSKIIQVYSNSGYRIGGPSLSYYYLPNKYKNDVSSLARVQNEQYLGDAVAYNQNSCFFGLTESKYWTPSTKELFSNCVSYVVSGTNNEEPPEEPPINGTGIHDVEIEGDYTNSINGIRIRDVEAAEYLMENPATLFCNKSYTISYRTINNGEFTEDIEFYGTISGLFNWTSSRSALLPGTTTTAGSKTVNVDFSGNLFQIIVEAKIPVDDFPENNIRTRQVFVTCSNSSVVGDSVGGTISV